MNKRIDLTNLGGLPMTQFTLSEMQDSYRPALAAMANLVGDKTILYGVESDGVNVTSGWIAVAGELIPFVGGPLNAKVVITEAAVSRTFEDTTVRDVYFTKTATCALLGDFNFSELVTLLPFANVWLPGDLKQKYVDNAYIAANFDAGGYGLNKEKGWRILSSAVPAAAGKVLVNRDAVDIDFDTSGKNGGAKTHTLSVPEMPSHSHGVLTKLTLALQTGSTTNCWAGTAAGTTDAAGGGGAHNNLQPYFVVLTLIKL